MKMPKVNEARNFATMRFQPGRPRWLMINRDREALAVWNGWVLQATSHDDMMERAKLAFADELERSRP